MAPSMRKLVAAENLPSTVAVKYLDEHIYADSGVSGLSKQQSAFDELMKRASSLRLFGCVLVVSVDRLTRSLPYHLEIRRILQVFGICLFLLDIAPGE